MDLRLHGIIVDENFMFDIILITTFIIVVVECDSVGFFVLVGKSFNLANDAVGLWELCPVMAFLVLPILILKN